MDEDGVEWGKYLRIRVNFDTIKPLPRGKLVKIEGKQFWVEFKYEILPLFCFHCGVIQHVNRSCVLGRSITNSRSEVQSQYEQWLRTTAITMMDNGDKRIASRGNRG